MKILVLYLTPDLWDADFEVKFSSSKTLVGEKISAQYYCLRSCMSIWNLCKFYIISQETTEFSRAPIIDAFDILRANLNDIFVLEFNTDPRNELKRL